MCYMKILECNRNMRRMSAQNLSKTWNIPPALNYNIVYVSYTITICKCEAGCNLSHTQIYKKLY